MLAWALRLLDLGALGVAAIALLLVAGYFLIGPGGRGPAAGIDRSIAGAFTHLQPSWLVTVARDTPLVALALLVLLLGWAGRDRLARTAVAAIVSVGGAVVAGKVIKIVIARPRPPHRLAAVRDTGFGFPSNHTLAAAAIAGVVLVAIGRLPGRQRLVTGCLAVIAVIAVAIARLILGVHWFFDVAVAAAWASTWAVVASRRVLAGPSPAGFRRWGATWRRPWARAAGATAVVVIVALLVPVGLSYRDALTAPGSEPLSVRSVDWLRGHGGARVVDWVENYWYSRIYPPPKGHAPVVAHPFTRTVAGSPVPTGPRPRTVNHPVRPARRGEGVWAPAAVAPGPRRLAYTAYWRPDPRHTGVLAAGLWLRGDALRAHLVAGTLEPGGSGWPWGAEIPPTLRTKVIAAVNDGFLFKAAEGGFYQDGRVGRPLRQGAASLVVYRNGRVDIGSWGRRVRMSGGVVAVRQNLHLIVDHGKVVSGLRQNARRRWGNPRNERQFTWRSAVGVDAHGNVIYVAGQQLDLVEVAHALQQTGAVRGMELDIHPGAVTANLYRADRRAPGHLQAVKLLPYMTRPATRYLQPDQRDFIAFELR